MTETDSERALLRHTLATVAYRGGKAVRNAPGGFSSFRAAEGSRSPGEILAHIGDLFDWALSLANGAQAWNDSRPSAWEDDVARFHEGLARLDARFVSPDPLGVSASRLFQGPIADALTHIGQIAMLRRMAGAPIRGESYFKADIAAGRTGADQTAPRKEF